MFPPRGTPRVIAESVGGGVRELGELRNSLRKDLEPLIGWETRPYRPHVTLGRARRRGARGPSGNRLLPGGAETVKIPPFPADRLTLYRSETRPEGAEYEPLDNWFLGAATKRREP